MLTASSSVLPESFNYGPDDLESMRRAFRRACDENPEVTKTATQQYGLATAIVNRFQRGIDEAQLIAIALRKAN